VVTLSLVRPSESLAYSFNLAHLAVCSAIILSLRLTPMGRLRQSRDELSREGRPRFNGAVLPVTNARARWSRSIPSSTLRTMASRPEIVLDIVPREAISGNKPLGVRRSSRTYFDNQSVQDHLSCMRNHLTVCMLIVSPHP
jgi:hypothetical protein